MNSAVIFWFSIVNVWIFKCVNCARFPKSGHIYVHYYVCTYINIHYYVCTYINIHYYVCTYINIHYK